MTGEADLSRLLAGMQPVADPVAYLFCTTRDRGHPLRTSALMAMEEDEGLTLILPAVLATPDLTPVFACRRITLTIHSSLAAVGLIAAVTRALADDRIGCNPVAGYFHDHLFVAEADLDRALSVLKALPGQVAG